MNSITSAANVHTEIHWTENDQALHADWRSESGISPPRRVVIADDTMTADTAYRLACEGTDLLWRGDFQNARQLLQALARRVDRPSRKSAKAAKAIEQGLPLPSRSLFMPPLHHHAGLGEGEAGEHPHGIEGDQVTDAATEDHQQDSSKGAQHHDAVAEHQPVS